MKFESLPTLIKQKIEEAQLETGLDEENGLKTLLASPSSTVESSAAQTQRPPDLCLLACPTSLITLIELETILSRHLSVPLILMTSIPSTAPTSALEAKVWSDTYWSTGWKAHNAYGPQPSLVATAASSILPTVSTWLESARLAGQQCKDAGLGEGIGAVIVDPNGGSGEDWKGKIPVVVAAAGDARWAPLRPSIHTSRQNKRIGNGNPLAHAAMRAISLVGAQRVALAEPLDTSSSLTNTVPSSSASVFHDQPLTPLESSILSTSPLSVGGYLCAGLDIYLTHEPCVMCSMAIMHSRFERAVFVKEMPESGGLCAEWKDNNSIDGDSESEKRKGYGLFWLSELNWKMLAWQWAGDGVEDEEHEDKNDRVRLHA